MAEEKQRCGLFKRFLRPGALALIRYGPDADKLCIVVDIIDTNRALVDGGLVTGVERQSIPIRWLRLTDVFLKKLPRGVRTGTLKKAIQKDDVVERFNATSFGRKRLERERRANLTDFERFRLMVVKKQRAKIVRQKVLSLKKGGRGATTATGGKKK